MSNQKNKIRIGLLACSDVAKRRFVPALLKSTRAYLQSVGSRSAEKARVFASELGCDDYGSYEDLLSNPLVDAIYISTPPNEHEHWILEALNAGKHVLCEKPAVSCLQAADKIVAICREKQLVFLEGYMFLYHDQYQYVQQLVSSGAIGEIKYIASQFTYPKPGERDIRLDKMLWGGVLHDSAGYPVAASLLLDGSDVQFVRANKFLSSNGVDWAASMELFFASGAITQLFVGFGLQYHAQIEILGTRGKIVLDRAFSVTPDYLTHVTCVTDEGTQIQTFRSDQFLNMIDSFVEMVGDPRKAEEAQNRFARQTSVMERIYQCAEGVL